MKSLNGKFWGALDCSMWRQYSSQGYTQFLPQINSQFARRLYWAFKDTIREKMKS